jgi:hypothetical protein
LAAPSTAALATAGTLRVRNSRSATTTGGVPISKERYYRYG